MLIACSSVSTGFPAKKKIQQTIVKRAATKIKTYFFLIWISPFCTNEVQNKYNIRIAAGQLLSEKNYIDKAAGKWYDEATELEIAEKIC